MENCVNYSNGNFQFLDAIASLQERSRGNVSQTHIEIHWYINIDTSTHRGMWCHKLILKFTGI